MACSMQRNEENEDDTKEAFPKIQSRKREKDIREKHVFYWSNEYYVNLTSDYDNRENKEEIEEPLMHMKQ